MDIRFLWMALGNGWWNDNGNCVDVWDTLVLVNLFVGPLTIMPLNMLSKTATKLLFSPTFELPKQTVSRRWLWLGKESL
jgi:hypothetical protein